MLHALHHAACCFSKSRKAERILWRVRPGELSQATHCTRGATTLTYYNIYTYLFIYTSSHIISHRLTSSHIVSDRLTSSHIVSHRLTSSHIVSHHQSYVRTVQFWVNCVTMWIVWMCWIWGVKGKSAKNWFLACRIFHCLLLRDKASVRGPGQTREAKSYLLGWELLEVGKKWKKQSDWEDWKERLSQITGKLVQTETSETGGPVGSKQSWTHEITWKEVVIFNLQARPSHTPSLDRRLSLKGGPARGVPSKSRRHIWQTSTQHNHRTSRQIHRTLTLRIHQGIPCQREFSDYAR